MRKPVLILISGTTLVAVLGVLTTLIGCMTSSNWLPTAEQLLTRGMVPEGAESAALRRGRALAVTECAGCHRFYWPQEYPPGAWPKIVRDMGSRMSLGKEQAEALELYFLAASTSAQAIVDENSDAKSSPAKRTPH